MKQTDETAAVRSKIRCKLKNIIQSICILMFRQAYCRMFAMFHSSLLENLSSYAEKHLDIVQQIQLSRHQRFMSAEFSPSWACGRAVAQELGDDLMVCSFAGDVHKLYINGVRPEEYIPCLGLNVVMAGQVGWTDFRGRQHQNGGAPELWCQCGGLEWRQALLHPGPVSQCHVAMKAGLLEQWLTNVAEGKVCRRIEWYLRQRTRVTTACRCASRLPAC